MNTNYRRRLLKALAAAGALVGAGLSGLISQALASGSNPIAAGLQRFRGTLTVNGQPARVGIMIRAGDTIVTGPASEAVYVIGLDAFLQRDNSNVIFGDAASGLFRIVTGKLLSVFGQGQKTLIVSTPTIGIRGTGCYIESTQEQTYFCLCYGEAEVVPTAAPEQREIITARHHDHPLVINANAVGGTIMAAAPVINHTDVELIMLETLVGRQPPFYAVGSSY